MRQQPLVLAGLLTLALAVPAVAAPSAPWLHVRVTNADGNDNVNLNVPFSLAEGLITMAEHSEIHTEIQDGLPDGLALSDLRKMWKDLQGGGDADFLTLEDKGEEVRMGLEGDSLVINVVERQRTGSEEQIDVRVPTRLVDALFSGRGDELNFRAALDELRDGNLGDIVTVQGGDETVRIWVD